MFLSRKIYDDMVIARIQAVETARAYQETNKGLQVTLDWLRVRVTQMEKERAAMIFANYGVKVPVPEIAKAPDPFAEHPFNETFSFAGLSDAEADAQGITHDHEGGIVYGQPKK